MDADRRETLRAYLRAIEHDELSRRNFVKLLGASMALAGLDGCTRMPAERILPYVDQPELTPGVPLHYASALVLDGIATGVLVESHEGRPTKIEGNPDHPASLGAAGVFEQASVLALYDPHRAKRVRRGRDRSSWAELARVMQPTNLRAQVGQRGERLRILMEPTSSPLDGELVRRVMAQYPDAGVHFHAPLVPEYGTEPLRIGGRVLVPQYDLAGADIIVSVDADFLAAGPFHLRYARQFADRRRPERASGGMNRLYVIEPDLSVTGAVADHRLAARLGDLEAIADELLAALQASTAEPSATDRNAVRSKFVGALARDLVAHRGRSVVIAGPRLSARGHTIVHAINQALGNIGQTVWFTESPLVGAGDPRHGLTPLIAALRAGTVHTLVCLGGNPSYAMPGAAEFSAMLRRVPQSVYVGLFENETARDCQWMVPAAHDLERWGDARAYDGTLSILQPLIAPLYDGRTTSEVLAALLGEPLVRTYDLLRREWTRLGGTDDTWRDALGRGVVQGSAFARVAPPTFAVSRPVSTTTSRPAEIELAFASGAHVHDGRFADNAWLQELPHPITTLTWGNAAHVSATTAARLGVASEDIVRVEVDGSSVEMPLLVVPGHADDVVSLHFGYGRSGAEAVAAGVGANVYPLTPAGGGFVRTGAHLHRVRHTGLALTQRHWSLEPQSPARSMTLADVNSATPHRASRALSLYTPQAGVPDATSPQQWAMTIDLSACIGCGACVVACQAENNVPVVGADDVRKGREMHWLRIDRYVGATGDVAGTPAMIAQPMLCQQCEKAPCEYVCPVEATVHSPDGLNEMVYNRCVGTRFCSNNCPYKVRRFNWFDYNAELSATEAMAKNPDVTVRERGVMEKCTFCVQRIRETEMTAAGEDRALRTDEVRTACQQSCPTNAIVFGSLTDPRSAVHEDRDGPRAYAALEALGTQPRIRYLARVRNPNPELGSRG